MARKNNKHKTYVLDTNVLLHDCNAIYAFEDNDLVIPMVVLEELDNHKTRQDEVGSNARKISRILDELRTGSGSLHDGVRLPSGGTLKIVTTPEHALVQLPSDLNRSKNDHVIIAMMLHLKNAILISKDINVRVKCDALGIVCEDYKKARMASSIDDLYRGVRVVENVDEAVASFHQEGHVDPQTIGDFYPNEIVVLKTAEGGGTTLTRCDASGEKKVLVPLKNIKSAYGLVPKNKEQQFALDLLYDDKIKLVTLAGAAGCVVGATKVTIKVANGHWKMPEPVRYIDDIDE